MQKAYYSIFPYFNSTKITLHWLVFPYHCKALRDGVSEKTGLKGVIVDRGKPYRGCFQMAPMEMVKVQFIGR